MPRDERRGFATRAIHHAPARLDQEPSSVPIHQASTFRFESSEDYAETIAFHRPGSTYSRGFGNPTVAAFEDLMADLEGTEAALGFASGMAAIHTVFVTLAGGGDRVVASRDLYGGTYSLLHRLAPRWGIAVDLVDVADLAAVEAALPGAALLYVETVANPSGKVADLAALGALAREAGVPTAVDNTFTSPYLCRPAEHGFDHVIHSATKYIGGHHDLIGGVVSSSLERRDALRRTVIDTGGTMPAFEAWLAIRGLQTLGLRMDRHCASALRIAEYLEGHAKVERVHYAGLPSHPQHDVARRILPRGSGGVLSFEVRGGVDAGRRLCDALGLIWVATSLGGTHSLAGHAASTTHRQMDPEARRAAGVADGLVRLSVGLEDAEDLLADLDAALERA
ncbi:MAG: trans-sulfuration enzyme family protein [Actinomycetota bacterium]